MVVSGYSSGSQICRNPFWVSANLFSTHAGLEAQCATRRHRSVILQDCKISARRGGYARKNRKFWLEEPSPGSGVVRRAKALQKRAFCLCFDFAQHPEFCRGTHHFQSSKHPERFDPAQRSEPVELLVEGFLSIPSGVTIVEFKSSNIVVINYPSIKIQKSFSFSFSLLQFLDKRFQYMRFELPTKLYGIL